MSASLDSATFCGAFGYFRTRLRITAVRVDAPHFLFATADGKSERNKRCNARGELRTPGLVPRGFSCEIFELRVNHILDSASCTAQYPHSSSFLLSHFTRVALQSKSEFLHLAKAVFARSLPAFRLWFVACHSSIRLTSSKHCELVR